MTSLWMLYSIAVAGLLGVAALACEEACRARGLPARAVWITSLGLSWIVPVAAWLNGRGGTGASVGLTGSAETGGGLMTMPALVELPPAAVSWLAAIDPWAFGLAATAGSLGLLALILALARLTHRARSWPAQVIQRRSVRISRDFGPVVVGLRRPLIVIPEWVLSLTGADQSLVVRHEDEHRRRGDPALLLVGAMAVLAAPWNPALWWQMRRLRLATELDCDARVLAGGASPTRYGSLLLDVGRRHGRHPWPLAALSDSSSFLERRLNMIVNPRAGDLRLKPAALFVAALLLIVAACETPIPPSLDESMDQAVIEVDAAMAGAVASEVQPLVVVNGVVTALTPTDANELDIESIEVLKGQAATDSYGPQGAAGVIQILTRRGAEAERVATPRAVELKGPNAPLIYVDGIRIDSSIDGTNPLELLNPDDIDRIEVIKGGAAEAIYGPTASAGVIQIFMKGRTPR